MADALVAAVFFGGAGLVLGFLAGRFVARGRYVMALAVLAAVGFLLWQYLAAPTDAAPEGCSDCGEYLGRWWEPGLVLIVLFFNLLAWSVGASAGRAMR